MTVRSVGTDPHINEQGILGMLRDEGFPLTPNGVRSTLSMVLLGCHDRLVKRRFMAEMLDLSAMIHINISKLEAGMMMRAAMAKMSPETSTEYIDAELQKGQEEWKVQRRQLAEKWALVCECPTASDTIS